MHSAGIDLQRHVDSGLLVFESARPSLYGLEMHLARMHRDIVEFNPAAVVVDPISAFRGVQSEIHGTLLRLADICKERGITAFFTSLSLASDHASEADRGVSSLMDTWISLTDLESSGERNRVMFVLKARGMSHSNQMREYLLTGSGIKLIDPYVGQGGVLTGTARQAQEARERNETLERSQAIERRQRDLDRRRATVERQIAELRAAMEAEESEASMLGQQESGREEILIADRLAMATKRGAAE
jgi:circadian clock protein KaiC